MGCNYSAQLHPLECNFYSLATHLAHRSVLLSNILCCLVTYLWCLASFLLLFSHLSFVVERLSLQPEATYLPLLSHTSLKATIINPKLQSRQTASPPVPFPDSVVLKLELEQSEPICNTIPLGPVMTMVRTYHVQ